MPVDLKQLRWVICLTALLSGPLVTQAATESEYDQLMRERCDAILGAGARGGHTSAAVATFVRDGQLRFAVGYGVEDQARRTPVDANLSLFRVASITKTFTAIQVARMKERGLIGSYTDAVNHYLTDARLPDWHGQPVTIKELFTHTGGLDEDEFNLFTPRLPQESYRAQDLSSAMPPLFRRPGDFTAYSNYGFDLLGAMAADLEHKNYVAGIRQDILEPLGMHATRFLIAAEHPTHLVQGFIPNTGTTLPDMFLRTFVLPSGGMASTGMDMGRYMLALLGGDSTGAVTAAIRHDLFSVQQSNKGFTAAHGLAFDFNPLGAKLMVQHGGSLEPQKCWLALSFERNAGLFYCYVTWDTRRYPGATPALDYEETAKGLLSALLAPEDPRKLLPPAGGTTGWLPRWSEFLGTYVTMRRQHHGFGRLYALQDLHATVVSHTADDLVIGDRGPGRELSPGVFATGPEIVAFTPDPDGGNMVMTTSLQPSAFERVSGLENPELLRPLLYLLVGLAFTGLLYPAWGLGSTGGPPKQRRRAAMSGALLLTLAVAGSAGVLFFTGTLQDDPYDFGVAWPIWTAKILAASIFPAAILLTWALTRPATVGGTAPWRWLERAHLVLLAATAAGAILAMLHVGMFSFDIH